MENGSYAYAGYASINLLYQIFFGTETLSSVQKTVDEFIPILKNVDPNMRRFHLVARQAIHNLTLAPDMGSTLIGHWINEDELLRLCKETLDIFTQFTYYTFKMGLSLWFGKYQEAVELGDECKKYLTPGVFINPVFHFMHAFSLAVTWEQMTPEQQELRRIQIKYYLDRLILWSKNCPNTYTHMKKLIEAKLKWIEGHYNQAIILFDDAIESAVENKFLHNAALGAELVGRLYQELGQNKIASVYEEAIHYFELWGATGRVKMMKIDYQKLLILTRKIEIVPN